MGIIITLTFLGVFALIALPLLAKSLLPSNSAKKALETLDSAIRAESNEIHELVIDLRKNETVEQHSVAESQAAQHGAGASPSPAAGPGRAGLELRDGCWR